MIISQPANQGHVVTTHDTTNLPLYTQRGWLTTALYVGGTGHLVAVMEDGTTCLFSAIPVGAILPVAVKRINATSTTATLIVALYNV